ncbi:hypothetical protein [Caulobacter sp. NIBR2454]|uniref:hypothetical protein n=1 Tax=Caulobacter sp. NIBR2454 TaxID=3015996 RepID=UPI0022B5FFD7|nr:hypothetical protein [Caulobacter sp. NIBR2454]
MIAAPAQAQAPAKLALKLVDVGRYAAFVDEGAIAWTGRTARLRVLQVVETDFIAAGEAYWGGWQVFSIDCDARTLVRGGYASIRANSREGPLSGGEAKAETIPAGGMEEAAARLVCDGHTPFPAVTVAESIEQAVKIGRPLIETGLEPN